MIAVLCVNTYGCMQQSRENNLQIPMLIANNTFFVVFYIVRTAICTPVFGFINFDLWDAVLTEGNHNSDRNNEAVLRDLDAKFLYFSHSETK